MKSLIQLAESEQTKLPDRSFPGPSIVHLWQEAGKIRARTESLVEIVSGSIYAGYAEDFDDAVGWLEWEGNFRVDDQLGFQITPNFAITMFWRTGVWRHTEYFIEIERYGQTLTIWTDEAIARRIFAEAFNQVPTPPRRDPRRSRKPSPHRSIAAARDAIGKLKLPSIAMGLPPVAMPSESSAGSIGFSLETICSPCLN